MTSDELNDFAARYAKAWCSQNPESVAAFFAENGSLKVNNEAPAVGRAAIPEIAPFLTLSAEIRTPVDPRSTLYNTDGQIFSDAGVPCVLFMENYDINRSGYHDTHDTMANIDLDYGAAVAAITIESVARAATQKPI